VTSGLEDHYRLIGPSLLDADVVPVLGAGVNRVGRPPGTPWVPLQHLPDGRELARHLAKTTNFPDQDGADLVRVSQYYAVLLGLGRLYRDLRELFDVDFPPTPVHTFLAGLPAARRRNNGRRHHRHDLIVTTNYDDSLERAFRDAQEPFDLVTYQAVGPHQGCFLHFRPGEAEPVVIEVANKYVDVDPNERTVILKSTARSTGSTASATPTSSRKTTTSTTSRARTPPSCFPSSSPRSSRKAICSSSATACGTGTCA